MLIRHLLFVQKQWRHLILPMTSRYAALCWRSEFGRDNVQTRRWRPIAKSTPSTWLLWQHCEKLLQCDQPGECGQSLTATFGNVDGFVFYVLGMRLFAAARRQFFLWEEVLKTARQCTIEADRRVRETFLHCCDQESSTWRHQSGVPVSYADLLVVEVCVLWSVFQIRCIENESLWPVGGLQWSRSPFQCANPGGTKNRTRYGVAGTISSQRKTENGKKSGGEFQSVPCSGQGVKLLFCYLRPFVSSFLWLYIVCCPAPLFPECCV